MYTLYVYFMVSVRPMFRFSSDLGQGVPRPGFSRTVPGMTVRVHGKLSSDLVHSIDKAQTCDEPWTFPATFVRCAHSCHLFAHFSYHDYHFKTTLEDKPEILEQPEPGTGRQFKPPGVELRQKSFVFCLLELAFAGNRRHH